MPKISKNTNAFPVVAFDDKGALTVDSDMSGLTIRQYFAAVALQGLISTSDGNTPIEIVDMAVIMADALIKRLNE